MEKRYEVDEAVVTMEFDNSHLMAIKIEVKDEDLLPVLDVEDKRKMADLTRVIAANLLGVLANRSFVKSQVRFVAEGPVGVEYPKTCPRCGKPTKYEDPCCGRSYPVLKCSDEKCPWKVKVEARPQ